MAKSSKRKIFSIVILLLLLIVGIRSYLTGYSGKEGLASALIVAKQNNNRSGDTSNACDILRLTDEKVVVTYLKEQQQLPDYYITKKEAREKGWRPEEGNLCEVLPGKAIGGDRFGNRERKLPSVKGRKYYEADINYNCGRRNADRLVYSNDGLIFITKDHYQSFQKQ